jgi:hypothetical protein
MEKNARLDAFVFSLASPMNVKYCGAVKKSYPCRWYGRKYFRLLMAGEDIRAAKCVYQRKCDGLCSRVGFHDEIVSASLSLHYTNCF